MAFLPALLAAVTLAGSTPSAPVVSTPAPNDLAGDWAMHIYVGKRLFEDRVHVVRGADGQLTGTVTVPDRFTSPLENVVVNKDLARFEIVGHERGEAFRVRYEGHWDAKGTIFVGLATLPEEHDALLGGFVAQR